MSVTKYNMLHAAGSQYEEKINEKVARSGSRSNDCWKHKINGKQPGS